MAQLLCLVPEFASYVGVDGDSGLSQLLEAATCDRDMYAKVVATVNAAAYEQDTAAVADPDEAAWGVYRRLTSFLLKHIHKDKQAAGQPPALQEGQCTIYKGRRSAGSSRSGSGRAHVAVGDSVVDMQIRQDVLVVAVPGTNAEGGPGGVGTGG